MTRQPKQPHPRAPQSNDPPQPPEPAPFLAGFEGVEQRLASDSDPVRIAALPEALDYGREGFQKILEIVRTETGPVQWAAYDLLWNKSDEAVKQKLVKYSPLRSQVGADYSKLRDLLEAHQWKKADWETRRMMLLVAGADKRDSLLTQQDIEQFPCIDLRTINKLWVQNSAGRFGFSAIARIYKETGLDYAKLADRVGWRRGDKWLGYENLIFEYRAPIGHLPISWVVPSSSLSYWVARFAGAGWALLLARAKSCNL